MAEEVMIYRPIPGYDGYTVDKFGNVYGLNGQELKKQMRRGIPAVTLLRDGKATSSSVQRLMCLAWYGEPEPGQVALRIGRNRKDVSLGSVAWGVWEERRTYED